ncbi:MAG: DUF2306 domain-containing protein [Balneolales bacterium]|nr:DUF2306 domain-containing protein [Balneolales bacterium]
MTTVGLIHFYTAIAALATGTFVMFWTKGTRIHKLAGYGYCIAMFFVLATAFMLFSLFGGWGIFHWAAVISSATLLAGMIPLILRKPRNNYISLHFSFMYWSVMGLYAAFFAETMVRLPEYVGSETLQTPLFYQIVISCLVATMIIGAWFFIRNSRKWEKNFGKNL